MSQNMEALRLANEIRDGRVKVKRRLFAGDLSLEEALQDPSCQTARVLDLLIAQRRWGHSRANKALIAADNIWPNRQVRQLTDRQRKLLIAVVAATRDACKPAAAA